jgi:hypothetical protein
MKKSCLAVVLCALCSGCGTSTAPSWDAAAAIKLTSTGWDNSATPTELQALITAIETRKAEYKAASDRLGTGERYFSSGLIALVSGAVSAAFFGGNKDLIGGIGLATGAVTAYRNEYDLANRSDAYLKGAQALDCISDTAHQMATADPATLKKAETDLSNSLQTLEQQQQASPSDGTNSAIVAVNASLIAVRAQLAAYNDAPFTIRSAARAINNYVQKANQVKTVIVGDIHATLANSLTTASQGAAATTDARAKWAQAVKDTANQAAEAKVAQAAAAQQTQTASTQATKASKAPASLNATAQATAATQAATAQMQAAATAKAAADKVDIILSALPAPLYTDVMARITVCAIQ